MVKLKVLGSKNSSICEFVGGDTRREIGVVAGMTEELFGRPASFRPAKDPDTGDSYLVVEVAVSGTDDQLLRLAEEWHRKLTAEIAPAATYSLSLQFSP